MRDCVPCQDAICFSSRAFCVDEEYLSSNLQLQREICCRCLCVGVITSVHPFSHRLFGATVPPTNHIHCIVIKQYVAVWVKTDKNEPSKYKQIRTAVRVLSVKEAVTCISKLCFTAFGFFAARRCECTEQSRTRKST